MAETLNMVDRKRSFERSENGVPVALTIAGFDPSSGAGITADVQVFAAHRLFGVCAMTAHTVQSTQGVAAVVPQDPATLRQTLEALADDFVIAGVKIGMLGTAGIVRCAAQAINALRAGRAIEHVPVVLDPVLVSSSGKPLLSADGVAALQHDLLPAVQWVTPNWAELSALTGLAVDSIEAVRAGCEELGRRYPGLNIVATGGDQARAIDVLRTADGATSTLDCVKIKSMSTHGTGCAFSSALLARLIHGEHPQAAVQAAKAYVEGAIKRAPGLGKGRGPLNFFWER